MEEPLFGEKKPSTQLILYVIGAIVSVFVLFTIIITVVYGILRDRDHFVLALAMISNYVVLVVLFKWWNKGDLDNKFKYLLVIVVVTVLVTGIACNVYAWKPLPKGPPPIQCTGLYRVADGFCFTNLCNYDSSSCLQVPTGNGTDYSCQNICNSNTSTTGKVSTSQGGRGWY